MRLLTYKNGEFSLATFFGDDIPPYAILSHRWGAEEVTLKDLTDGTGMHLAGYDKLRFCGEQAKRDGLPYFWVDTCCIDKSNNTELAESINSMFRWYQHAIRCYVYLPDVSRSLSDSVNKSNELFWESAFRKSTWFTRGWTLQELIAPALVEFFSKEGVLLGDKRSLERHICDITGIPAQALQGRFSDFSVTERMAWAESRETARKEDKAYSLLGIFDVSMPLIYGEGEEKAIKRLRQEIDKDLKGFKHQDFSVSFSLSSVHDVENFVARKEELVDIHKVLHSDGSRRIAVLHGLGGIGKTQLSIAYAKRHKNSYSAIFWLNSKDEDSLKQSFAKIAKQILRQHPSADFPSNTDMKENPDKVVDAVKAWLSLPDNTRWLLIYDNYDRPKMVGNMDPLALDIRNFLPESYQGSIIITTRSSQIGLGCPLQIRKLNDVKDSLEILSNASRRAELGSNPDAIQVARELDGLPLALATAGAYLDQSAISFSGFLRLYKQSWTRLQESSPDLSSYEDQTLYSTWSVSFEHVKQQSDLSAKLLCFWAYFDNQDLWLELLQHCDLSDPDWVRAVVKDELSFHQAMRILSNHGLVEVDMSLQELTESRGYSIHGCVHSWIVHVLNQEWDYDLARLAVKCVGAHVPGEQTARPWLTQRRLLQHAMRCSEMFLNNLATDDGLAREVHSLGSLYKDQSKLVEAERMYQRALHGYEKAFGILHSSTIDVFNEMGIIYSEQNKLAEAEQMYKQALLGRAKTLGTEDPLTLNIVSNLGILYNNQGKLAEAEQMFKQALLGKEKALGTEHTSTLDTVCNLGNLYNVQSKLVEAEQLYQRALLGIEKAHGPDHLSTLNVVNNLGGLYFRQGKLTEAEEKFQRVLSGREKALGVEHLSTLRIVGNLGTLYRDQGRLVDAKQMCHRVLQGYKKALGTEKYRTYVPALDTIVSLGACFEDQADLAQARTMYSEALSGYEIVFGSNHSSPRWVRKKIQVLDTMLENENHKKVEEPENKITSRSGIPLKSKCYKLLQKCCLR